jgi:hypothetical protein
MIGAIFDGFLGGVISNLTENFLSIFSYKFIITVYFLLDLCFLYLRFLTLSSIVVLVSSMQSIGWQPLTWRLDFFHFH